MRTYALSRSVLIPRPLHEVFDFFADAANLQALTPPWVHFSILTPLPIVMAKGRLIDYRIRLHGIPIRWQSIISEWDPPRRFTDDQTRGPHLLWRHEHSFTPAPGGVMVRDDVLYAVRGGPLAPLLHRILVRPDLDRIFDYRRAALLKLLAAPKA